MMRSVLSVVTSSAVWGVLWVAANLGLAALMPGRFGQSGIPSPTDVSMLILFIAICGLLCVLAGWICAAIAPRSALKHVFVLALVQLAIGIFVQAGVWDLMPVWYHLTFLGIVVPMHLVGGCLRLAGSCLLWSPAPFAGETTT